MPRGLRPTCRLLLFWGSVFSSALDEKHLATLIIWRRAARAARAESSENGVPDSVATVGFFLPDLVFFKRVWFEVFAKSITLEMRFFSTARNLQKKQYNYATNLICTT